MTTDRYWMWELPERLEGVVVVVDVFGATTNMAILVSRARRVLLVNDGNVVEAKQHYPSALVIGESLRLPGSLFDISIDPARVTEADVAGRDILFMSINGTRAVEAAVKRGATRVLAGSFVNMDVLVSYLQNNVRHVSLIACGDEGVKTDEDWECIAAAEALAAGRAVDWRAIDEKILAFMRRFYRSAGIDRTAAVVLAKNTFPVLPAAYPEADGLIEMRPA